MGSAYMYFASAKYFHSLVLRVHYVKTFKSKKEKYHEKQEKHEQKPTFKIKIQYKSYVIPHICVFLPNGVKNKTNLKTKLLMKKVLLLTGLLLPYWGGNLFAQLSIPCTLGFPDEKTFNTAWKTDDTDRNEEVFTFDAANLAAKLTCKGYAEDWLINTQGIELKAGETYSIKVNVKTDASYNSQYFYTYFGKSPEIADLTQRVETSAASIKYSRHHMEPC